MPVRQDISNRRRDHTVCGFSGLVQIVCCPQPTIQLTTTEAPSNRISALSKFEDCEEVLEINWNYLLFIECTEYQDAVYEKVQLTASFGNELIDKKIDRCAYTAVPLIVGGTEAKRSEFPHMVGFLLFFFFF